MKDNDKGFRSNLISGFATGLFSIPEGMAYAKLAGVNPVYGLYSGMVATLVASMTTGSVLMISTLTSAIALSTASVIAVADIQQSQLPHALFTVTFLVGVVMFLLGLLRLGSLVNFVSNAVMTGFVAGASLLIMIGELGDFSGYEPVGANKLVKVFDWFGHIGEWDPVTTAVGLSTIVLMLLFKRFKFTRRLAAIITLGLMTVVVHWLDLPAIELVGSIAQIPNALPMPMLPSIELMPKLVLGSVSVALVALVQGAGISTAYTNPDGNRSRASRDFIGQGLGNLAGSFFQSMATGGSLSRTGISVSAGASSRWGGIFAALWLAVIVVLFGQLAELVPLSVIAGMLMVIATELILGRVHDARLVWASSYGSVAAGLLTFICALFIPLQWTVFLGTGFSIVLYVYSSAMHVEVKQLVPRADGKFKVTDLPTVYPSGAVTILTFRGTRFFAEISLLDDLLPSRRGVRNATIIMRTRWQETVSSTALKWLQRYQAELQQGGNRLLLAGVSKAGLKELEKAGLLEQIGRQNIFLASPVLQESLSEALAAARQLQAEDPC